MQKRQRRIDCTSWILVCIVLSSSSLGQSPLRSESMSTDAAAAELVRTMQDRVQRAIVQARDSVVAIARVSKQRQSRQQAYQFELGNGFLPELSPEDPDFVPTSYGTGVVWDATGNIVTPYHVLGDPRENDYYVWSQSRFFPAKAWKGIVQAGDAYCDLAVLKIEANNLVPLPRGDASELKMGQFLISLGNPYAIARDGKLSASWGIVSNLLRPVAVSSFRRSEERPTLEKETLHHYGTMIETTCRLPQGTSGGALIDLEGKWVGMTVSLAALEGHEQSAGFAMAVDDTMKRVVDCLIEGRLPVFGFLGIQPEDLPVRNKQPGSTGVRVVNVVRGMPGDLAGVQGGDVIVAVGGQPVDSRNALFRELSSHDADANVSLSVVRAFPNEVIKTIELQAKLSKKYITTKRPSYSIHPANHWRGLQVEYVTALPAEMIRFPSRGNYSGNTGVAILSVEPGSSAWRSGLRPGQVIFFVDEQVVTTPREFQAIVETRANASVRLKVLGLSDRVQDVSVGPE